MVGAADHFGATGLPACAHLLTVDEDVHGGQAAVLGFGGVVEAGGLEASDRSTLRFCQFGTSPPRTDWPRAMSTATSSGVPTPASPSLMVGHEPSKATYADR